MTVYSHMRDCKTPRVGSCLYTVVYMALGLLFALCMRFVLSENIERMREGHCLSDEHWNRFKIVIGKLLRDGVDVGFSEHIDTVLN